LGETTGKVRPVKPGKSGGEKRERDLEKTKTNTVRGGNILAKIRKKEPREGCNRNSDHSAHWGLPDLGGAGRERKEEDQKNPQPRTPVEQPQVLSKKKTRRRGST